MQVKGLDAFVKKADHTCKTNNQLLMYIYNLNIIII